MGEICTFPKIIWEKNSVKNKQKKKSSRLYRKESSSRAVHRKQFFYLRVAAVSNQLFRATGITVNCDHQKGFQFIHIVKDGTPSHL